MKKLSYLALLFCLLATARLSAQAFNVSIPTTACTGTINAVVTVTAPGATTYSWIVTPGAGVWVNQLNASNSNAAIYFPSPGAYTVSCSAINPAASPPVIALVNKLITIAPSPTISVIGTPSVCSGASGTLVATGAVTYTWNNGSTSAMVIVNPLSTTCYSVIGADANGCRDTASYCISSASLSAGVISPTVCLGSSASFTAAGASTYTWSNGANTPTTSIIPTASGNYSVACTFSNGCNGSATVAVVVDTTCSNVWPGDANNDGLVDATDVLEIGLAFASTGPVRGSASILWTSQYANNWVGLVSTGKNKCHADCNGDGTVDNGDTLAIYNNFSLTHPFRAANSTAGAPITLVPDQLMLMQGSWSKADIVLGDAANPLSQLYGVAYDINFDQNMIETDSVYITYTSSFLSGASQNVNFRKTGFTNGKLYTASVRKDGQNVSGNGKIGELHYKLKVSLSNGSQLALSVSNSQKISNAGTLQSLNGGSSIVTIDNTITGIYEQKLLKNTVSLYPNPGSGRITLQSLAGTETSYVVFDVTGREVTKGNFTASKTIDVSGFANGPYIVRFGNGADSAYKKLVVEH